MAAAVAKGGLSGEDFSREDVDNWSIFLLKNKNLGENLLLLELHDDERQKKGLAYRK
jgi:hypothetical protein